MHNILKLSKEKMFENFIKNLNYDNIKKYLKYFLKFLINLY